MAFQREFWRNNHIGRWTRLPCPHCARGWIKLDPESLNPKLAKWRASQRKSHDELEWEDSVFTCSFVCDGPWCGEIVAVAGKAVWRPYQNQDGQLEFDEHFEPQSMVPSPPVITFPEQTPKPVQDNLLRSFRLFWMDLASSANALRISVERLLDEFGIPKLGNIEKRIDKFGQQFPDYSSILHALRHVGNTGSHEGAVDRKQLLDAFEVLDHALEELFSGRKQRVQTLAEGLIKTKGKPTL